MKVDAIKEKLESFWDELAEGWRHLSQVASGALTRFKSGDSTNLPEHNTLDDHAQSSGRSWTLIGGDLFEDEHKLVVRLELPGMDKEQISAEVREGTLLVSGEKRFQRESSEGRWRVMQCAYGSFTRSVPLPCAVLAEQSQASYTNGILRVELPKAKPGKPNRLDIRVS
jgi:HSP20 family protein